MDESLILEQGNGVARITLNRPKKLNPIDGALLEHLSQLLAELAEDDTTKVLVVTGSGGNFSAGFAIADSNADSAERVYREWEKDLSTLLQLHSFPRPTIALVRGWCLGGGCELAMACDLIVAADSAKFGEPEIRFGSSPVALLLPFLIGPKISNELLLTGSVISATRAAQVGMINRAVPEDEVEAALSELTSQLLPTPLPVLRLTKTALRQAADQMGLRDAINASLALAAILNATNTPEKDEFRRIVQEQGVAAALRWRDARYGTLSTHEVRGTSGGSNRVL